MYWFKELPFAAERWPFSAAPSRDYELPTDHCPFCLLQKEYGRIGYPLYASLFGSALGGTGVGILIPFGRMKSLSDILPGIQKKLAAFSLSLALLFCLIVLFVIMRSTLKLF